MTTLDNNYIKSSTYGHLSLNQRIALAAEKVANGEVINFRGASVTTYAKVMRLANKIKQDRDFPLCPCEECN
jgi:ribosomal 50S subunit-recycling heat shock protein